MARRGRRPKGLDDDFEEYKINIEEDDDELATGEDPEEEVDEEIDLESRRPFADDMFENFDEDDY